MDQVQFDLFKNSYFFTILEKRLWDVWLVDGSYPSGDFHLRQK